MRVILGIQEAHDASAALMVDGRIVAAAQEERFTGLKGDYGLPVHAITACMKQTGIKREQIDEVALSSHAWNPVLTKIKRNANFKVSDWVKEQREFWYPKIFEQREVNYYDLYKDCPDFVYDSIYPMDHLLKGYMNPKEMEQMAQIRIQMVSDQLGIPREKIRFVTHEDCHTYYAYFASPLRGKLLVLTSEGIGDYSNGTVSEFSESCRTEIARAKENHLGHIYQYITLILGMKPAQHEYKVMGLAPYANIKELEKSYAVFAPVLKVDGLNIVFDKKPGDLYFHFRDALEGHRFDGIAGGLQKFLEDILCAWVRNCVAHTGLKRVCFAGGVAQNIKACKSIGELPEVEDLYICPASGDTSLPIGACYYSMWEYAKKTNQSYEILKPVDSMYLGPEFLENDVQQFIETDTSVKKYSIIKHVTPEEIAIRLAGGHVIGRCCGRMEFGLRALGNRSILADPREATMVRKINDAIKFRDFWMPFTPTILAERQTDYIINPKNLKCPHMTMAFDSTPLAKKELIAALHPADLTMRPQILKESDNPAYYAIIKAFETQTGVGGILNTSFNLHGDPIVLGPKEAVYTFENSALDDLLLGNYLISR